MDTTLSMTSHGELSEVGELNNLRWHRLQLVHSELKMKGDDRVTANTMDTTLSMISHIEQLKVGELTNLRWDRLQLVLKDLKGKGGDETIASQQTPCKPLSQ